MLIEIKIAVEVERTEGKFASREELAQQIMDELEAADPGSLIGDEGGVYEVAAWDVEEIPHLTKAERVRAKLAQA